MPRVHCASCGAPSVLGASRCPRCLAPFGAAGPMSGMVLAAEESTPRPTPRWWIAGAAVLAVLIAVGGLGLWAARRARGGETPRVTEEPTVPVAPAVAPAVASAAAPTIATTSIPVSTAPVAVTPTPAPVQTMPPPVATNPAPPRPAESAPTPRRSPPVPTRTEDGTPATTMRATTWIWLRADPNNRAEQLAVVNPKTVVRVLERRFGWVRVQVGGREGWMSAELLERVPE